MLHIYLHRMFNCIFSINFRLTITSIFFGGPPIASQYTHLFLLEFLLMVLVDHAYLFSNQPLEKTNGDDRDEV